MRLKYKPASESLPTRPRVMNRLRALRALRFRNRLRAVHVLVNLDDSSGTVGGAVSGNILHPFVQILSTLNSLLPARIPSHHLPTRWSTTLSSKVNLPQEIHFRVFCGANLVTYPAKFRGVETRVPHLFDRRGHPLQTGVLLSQGGFCPVVIDSGLVGSTNFHLGGAPREQKILKGPLFRVIYHNVF